jgi:formylglycine-generating enzyme required for sulfatase activity
LIGCRYAWGNEPPRNDNCDFGRLEPFMIKPSRTFPPNGYGLYAMCGSVWEWTSDLYLVRPYSRAQNRGAERVLRGGSWTDPAEVVTVSFRMSREGTFGGWQSHLNPNIGFRLCRQQRFVGDVPRGPHD